MIERLSKIPLIALPVLYISGCLFHFAFWSRFKLDGLSYMNITDIITTSIYPIMTFGGIYLFLDLFVGVNYQIRYNNNSVKLYKIIFILVFAFTYKYCSLYYWFFWGIAFGIILADLLYIDGMFKNTIKDNITRLKTLKSVCLLLSLAYTSGKYKSDKIYLNDEFRYALVDCRFCCSEVKTRIKYLGVLGQNHLFTNLNNNEVLMYKNIDSLVLLYYNKSDHFLR